METSASFEARSAPSPYPTTVETSASFEARYAPLSYPTEGGDIPVVPW
jgi:hypothetical protein